MPEFLQSVLTNGAQASAGEVLLRLLAALGYGAAIAGIYRLTRGREAGTAFAMTLLLLSVLIAMVTQVIGDNVARAFSLVGALSIVRFRTVVKDTQDTAYVILAVIVGMAVGSWSLWVATLGIAVVGLAEALASTGERLWQPASLEYELKMRTGIDQDLDAMVKSAIDGMVESRQTISIGMVKQGECLEANYLVRPKPGVEMADLLRSLVGRPGVQSVQLSKKTDES